MKDSTKDRKLIGPLLIRSDSLTFFESDSFGQSEIQIFADRDHQQMLIMEHKLKKLETEFQQIKKRLQTFENKLTDPEIQQTQTAVRIKQFFEKQYSEKRLIKKPKLLPVDQMIDTIHIPYRFDCWYDERKIKKYKREEIHSIYILDSLESAPGWAWDVSAESDGSVKCWVHQVGDKKLLYIAGEGGVAANEDSHELFMDYFNAVEMNVNALDVSGVMNMSGMFAYCTNLETLDLSGWDVSNAKTMRAMFLNCKNLKKMNLSNWNTENVSDMSDLFSFCGELSEIDVRNWNTSRVTSMKSMFNRCESITSLDLSLWDISNVKDFSYMFQSCKNLETLNRNMLTGSAQTECMFNKCEKLDIFVPIVPVSIYDF